MVGGRGLGSCAITIADPAPLVDLYERVGVESRSATIILGPEFFAFY